MTDDQPFKVTVTIGHPYSSTSPTEEWIAEVTTTDGDGWVTGASTNPLAVIEEANTYAIHALGPAPFAQLVRDRATEPDVPATRPHTSGFTPYPAPQ